MKIERRNFLKRMAGVCAAGVTGKFVASVAGAPAVSAAVAPPAVAAATAGAAAGTAFGSGVRAQVFEVIVRQGMAGAPWKEICAGPMAINQICVRDVEAEIERRMSHVKTPGCTCHTCDRSHRETGFCNCEGCTQARAQAQKKYLEELESIPHSSVAPCPCNQCRAKINQLRAEFKISPTQS